MIELTNVLGHFPATLLYDALLDGLRVWVSMPISSKWANVVIENYPCDELIYFDSSYFEIMLDDCLICVVDDINNSEVEVYDELSGMAYRFVDIDLAGAHIYTLIMKSDT